jgi:hypothetical protein
MVQLIVRFFFNDLSPSAREKVAAHLSRCPHCTGRYQALAEAYSGHARG